MTPEDRARAADEAEEKRQKRIAFNRVLHVTTHWERPQQTADMYYISRETLRRFPEIAARWSEFKLAQFVLPKLVYLKRASFEIFNNEWIKATKPTKLPGNDGVVYLHGKPIEEHEFRKRHGITLITENYFCEKNEEGKPRVTITEEIITYKLPRSVDDALEFTPGRGRGFKAFGVCFSYLFGKGQPNYFDQAADITTGAKGGGMAGRALNRTNYNNENEHASDPETYDILRHAEFWSDMDAIKHREELQKINAKREEEKRRKFEAENPSEEEDNI